MRFTTLRARTNAPFNFEELYVGGIDVAELIKQSQGKSMAYTPTIVTVTERYQALSDGIGYGAGDVIRRTELIDISSTPNVSTVTWFNFTSNHALTVDPVFSELSLQQQTSLTNAELRNSPLIVTTDAMSPELRLLGNLDDSMSAVDGSGNYGVIAALKRIVNTLGRIAMGTPVALGQGLKAQSVPVTIAADQEALFASQVKQDSIIAVLSSLDEKLPLSDNGRLPVTVGDLGWNSVGYTLDTMGNLTSETQENSGQLRTRMWTVTTDSNGNTNYVAGNWL
jgi:hypothetical protein